MRFSLPAWRVGRRLRAPLTRLHFSRADELRAQAAQTDIEGYRDAALALADRYEQAAAARLASA